MIARRGRAIKVRVSRRRPAARALTRVFTSLLFGSLVASCGSRAVDATAVGAVRAFVEAMQRDDAPHAREEAYRLLCPAAQIALAERARESAALGGRSFEPWEMIVEDRALLLHPPRRSGAYRERAIEGDTELFPGIECILYPNSHTPGSQCVYIKTLDGIVGCVGDMVRKVDMNVRKAIPPGIFYDLEQMQRAMRDIAIRGDIIYPAHDPIVLEEDEAKRHAALSPGKPWP